MSAPISDKERIFAAAAELLTSQQRKAFLDAACGQDENLRQEVEKLLAHDDKAGSFLDYPAIQPPATDLFRPLTEGPRHARWPLQAPPANRRRRF
jgi:hypothetical protein